ncbi:hypothetical protein DIPPA_31320 [Diplonema papillatum]|nr:hypothetical protein DIPPA_09447 [Diplonema papillatum]KAJ9457068.1 hypothetical protein DIPPA_31320 [Diplonema papillatum]
MVASHAFVVLCLTQSVVSFEYYVETFWCESTATRTCQPLGGSLGPCPSQWKPDEETGEAACPWLSCTSDAGAAWSDCDKDCGGGWALKNITVKYRASTNATTYEASCAGKQRVPCNRRPCGVGRGLRVSTVNVANTPVRGRGYRVARGWLTPAEDATTQPRHIYAHPLIDGGLRVAWSSATHVLTLSLTENDEGIGDPTQQVGKEARGVTSHAFLALKDENVLMYHDRDTSAAVWSETEEVLPSMGDSRLADNDVAVFRAWLANTTINPPIVLAPSSIIAGVYTSAFDDGLPAKNGDSETYLEGGAVAPYPQKMSWRCAPSAGQQLVYNGWLKMFVSACVSACQPTPGILVFPAGTIPDSQSGVTGRTSSGIHVTRLAVEQTAKCTTRVAGEIGPIVPTPTGVLLIFTANRTAQEPYSPSMGVDVGVAELLYNASTGSWSVEQIKYLTASSARKTSPQLAAVGSGPGGDGYLVGWEESGRFYMTQLTAKLLRTEPEPDDVTSWVSWNDRNNWITTVAGEPAWVSSWDFTSPGRLSDFPIDGTMPYLKVVRFSLDYAAVIDQSEYQRCQGQGTNAKDPVAGCYEVYQTKAGAAKRGSEAPAAVIVASAATLFLAGAAAAYAVWRRKTTIVGQRRRRGGAYPWDDGDTAVEYFDLAPKG